MHEVSYVLAERFSQDPFETYLCKHPPGAWKEKQPLYDLGYTNTFRNQKASGKVIDGNIMCQIEPVQCWKKYKQKQS